MTQAIGGAPQSQNMADKLVRSSSSQAGRGSRHADAANGKASQDDVSTDRDRDARDARVGRTPSEDATAKAESAHPFRKSRDHGTDDVETDTFAATIDDLDARVETRAGGKQMSADATDVTTWNVGAAFAQIALDKLSGGDPSVAASQKMSEDGIARRAGMSKDVRALLDVADRIAAKHSDLPSDAMPEEELTANVTVNARETHWLFAGRKIADAGTDAARVDRISAGKIAPQEALAAKAQDMMQKSSATADKSVAGVTAQGAVSSDASRRQTFDGQRDGGARSREQSGGSFDDRRSAALSGAGKAERVALDTSAPASGIPGATQQLKTGIINALTGGSGDVAGARAAAFQATEQRPAMAGQVLRALDITLSPPDLGTVKLRLTLRSNALDIDAEASKASTAKLLNDDRKGLEQSLRESGYDVSSLKIADASATSQTNLNGGANSQNGGDPRQNFAGRQDADQRHRDDAGSNQSQQRSSGERSDSRTNEAGTRKANGIYI